MKAITLFLLALTSGMLSSCISVRVDHGPFDIHPDESLLDSKTKYLDDISSGKLTGSPPNILIILVDDLGKHDISVYDPGGVSVPNLEALASGGIVFTEAFSTSSVCSPSRAGLMTGRYQQRFGFERQPMNRYARNRLEYFIVDHLVNTEPMRLISPMARVDKELIPEQGIPPSEILLPEVFQHAGYYTALSGKWHLGYSDPFKPNARGFDYHYGFYEAFSLYAETGADGIAEYRHDYFANKHIWKQQRKGTCAIRINDSIVNEEEYLTFSIARQAIGSMDRAGGKPFFVVAAFNAPHTPFQVPEEYLQRFPGIEDPNRRIYCGMISALDDAVGMLLEALDHRKIADNTMVVFVSDNGGATYTGATENGPLKAGKFSQFEGGVNVPMILRWPGGQQQGEVFSEPVSLMDLFHTTLSAAGIPLPADREIDGVDLFSFINEPSPVPHEAIFWRTDFNKAVRTPAWKLLWNERDGSTFLYRFPEDKREQVSLEEQHPDVVKELKEMYRFWEQEMKPPMWPGLMEFRFDIDGETTWWAI